MHGGMVLMGLAPLRRFGHKRWRSRGRVVPAVPPRGAPHVDRPPQSRLSGHRRGVDRVHPGLVHRPPAPARPFLRFRRPGLRQDLHGADPARLDPRHPVGLFRPPGPDRPRAPGRRASAALRPRRPDRIPAGGGGRRPAARLHQGRFVQPVDRLHIAGRRRAGAPVGRSARPQAPLPRRHAVLIADVSRHRGVPVPGHDPGRIALRRHNSVGDVLGRRQALRAPNSRSTSPCRPWRGRSPTTSTRISAR